MLLLAAACGGQAYEAGGKTGASGKSDSSAAPPESSGPPKPTKAAPAIPKAAKSHTDPGAAAFLMHAIRVYNYGLDTDDRAAFSDLLEEKSCTKCMNIFPKPPKRIEGGHWKPGDASYEPDKDPYTAIVNVPISMEAGKMYPKPGAAAKPFKALRMTITATLSWKGDTWRIKNLEASRDG